MTIKAISIQNFKTFEQLEIELDNFNVMIGANAAGKSNFIQIFKFLRDIADYGLKNAISMQGGSKYITNTNTKSKDLILKVTLDQDSNILLGNINDTRKLYLTVKANEIIYELSIRFKQKEKFDVSKEKITVKGELFTTDLEKSLNDSLMEARKNEETFNTEIIIHEINNEVIINYNIPEDFKKKFDTNGNSLILTSLDSFPIQLDRDSSYNDTLLNIGLFPIMMIPPINFSFKGISIYDFDPKLPKKAVSITGKRDLEEDGSNLSLVLKSIIDSPKDKKKLTNLIKDVLPFFDGLKVNNVEGKYLSFNMCEVYNKKEYLPASLISDGTINITALIVALYFEKNPFIVLEEPERNMHPHLMSKVVNLLKDASSKKRIFVTTHNPEIIKHVSLENILLVYRDNKGYSRITKPEMSEDVQIFLKNNIGLDELFVDNSLW